MAVATANRLPRAISTTAVPLEWGALSFYELAEQLCDRPHFALVDGRSTADAPGSFSFFAFAPVATLVTKNTAGQVRIGAVERPAPDPFAAITSLLERWRAETRSSVSLPFCGGAIGYFAYELGRRLETLPGTATDDLDLPDCYLCFYNFAVVLDHETGRTFLGYVDLDCPDAPSLHWIRAELETARAAAPVRSMSPPDVVFTSDLTREEYIGAVRRIKEYITAGDVYQVNMTQRFSAHIGATRPWEIYRQLCGINPAPFAAYLNFDGHAVLSSSPERFLRVHDGIVETRPIKGTIARGTTPAADVANRSALFHSAKNRAELAMIVDLLRNDIGRVAIPGTVEVGGFPELETYASVHHLATTVTGRLPADRTIVDVLKAAFPGGSITGAPKIRAMEIIDELEPVARGVYTGSIGYIGFDGRADLNIAIRTLVVKDHTAYVHAGGGVVADSDEAEEYEESLLKAARLVESVKLACDRRLRAARR